MKVQEVISSCIMFIVSGLVLVGFTIAWFTNSRLVSVTGLEMQAVEMGHVRVALEPDGKDISELSDGEQYADIVIIESPGADTEERTSDDGTTTQVPVEFAPGAYGSVTFYVTPVNNSRVEACDIVPTLRITQDGNTWYPAVESEGTETGDGETGDTAALEALYAIAQKHIKFFKDEAMTQPLDADTPFILTWTTEGTIGGDSEGIPTNNVSGEDNEESVTESQEQKVVIYWKWYYEYYDDYPLTAYEQENLTDKQKIRKYDEEDMQLGNNITHMKFYVTFSAR